MNENLPQNNRVYLANFTLAVWFSRCKKLFLDSKKKTKIATAIATTAKKKNGKQSRSTLQHLTFFSSLNCSFCSTVWANSQRLIHQPLTVLAGNHNDCTDNLSLHWSRLHLNGWRNNLNLKGMSGFVWSTINCNNAFYGPCYAVV